jgi:hypothetical protein
LGSLVECVELEQLGSRSRQLNTERRIRSRDNRNPQTTRRANHKVCAHRRSPHDFVQRSFSTPLVTVDFHHTLSVADGITTIEHSVVMNGPLTPVFRRIIGTKIAKGLPTAVAALAALAEGAT